MANSFLFTFDTCECIGFLEINFSPSLNFFLIDHLLQLFVSDVCYKQFTGSMKFRVISASKAVP